jgi:hypothetical protein
MSAMFFCLLLSTCKVKYFLNCLDTIPQNIIISDNCLPFFILYHSFLSWKKSSSEMQELNINRIYFSILWACFICWENLRTIYLFSSSIKLQNIKCVGFYWRFHMMFLLSVCCVMDSKSSTASVNISLNSGSERKLTQLIVESPCAL